MDVAILDRYKQLAQRIEMVPEYGRGWQVEVVFKDYTLVFSIEDAFMKYHEGENGAYIPPLSWLIDKLLKIPNITWFLEPYDGGVKVAYTVYGEDDEPIARGYFIEDTPDIAILKTLLEVVCE